MTVFLYVAATIMFLGGLLMMSAANGAIHEIMGILAIGFSLIILPLAAILDELKKARIARG